MKQIDPHKEKYFNLYMRMAIEASKESVAVRRQVGAVIVLPNGLISLGWN
jgi:deoxycytidylate deaminase